MSKKIRLVLDDGEFEVLDKIAVESGMDCWFFVQEYKEKDGTKSDWVFDFENNRRVTLRYGVDMLHQGMTFYVSYNLTEREIVIFERLLAKLDLKEDRHLRDEPPTCFGMVQCS